jgi:iron complex transport system substrate-binding protein
MLKLKCTCLLLIFLLSPSALAAPMRIVSLKPNVTDIVYALGLGDKLVGVTRFCDVPAGAKKPAIVGDYSQAYIERIIALSPDIVIGSEENSSRKSIESLRRIGIRVEILPFTTISETLDSIRVIGKTLDATREAEELAQSIRGKFAAQSKKWGGSSPKRVVVVWGTRPLVVAGRGSYMDELLATIGAANAITGTQIKYPRIGIEEMIAIDPDAIVDLSMGNESGPDNRRPWDGISTLKAVREGRVISMNAARFRAGPGLPEALEELARRIH